jgi:hypothetical protein
MEEEDMRPIAQKVHLVIAWVLVAGLLVQIFLAGLGVFRGPESFPTHRDFGYVLELLPILLAIFGLFLLQSVFVALRASNPEVAALHPVNGFVITFLAVLVARDAWVGRAPASAR